MKTITFYSYKGGVGRSLVLANIASRLSEYGRQVCLLDFDLEAPGLHYKFSSVLNNRGVEIRRGIVDYIHHFLITGTSPDRILDYSYPFLSSPKAYTTLIPAGDTTNSNYWKNLSSISWNELLYDSPAGLSFLLELKQKIKKEIAPDFLLIDSRTGITGTSEIALSLLADDVVVVSANNRENIDGSKRIIKSITNPENVIIGKTPNVTFILSRVPFPNGSSEKEKEQNMVQRIKKDFGDLISEVNILHSDRELEWNEQIKIGYQNDESDATISALSRDYLNVFDKLTAGVLKPVEIESFNLLKESERYYQKALSETLPLPKLDFINHALRLNELNTEFILYKAAIYEGLEKWEDVIYNCDIILGRDTANLLALEKKGFSLLKLERYEDAKYSFRTILSFHENRLNAKLALADIFAYEKRYFEAINFYNEVIASDDDNAPAYAKRAGVELAIHNYATAIDDIYQALAIDSDFGLGYSILAEINLHVNNRNEFYLNLDKALKLDSKNVAQAIKSKDIFQRLWEENDHRFLRILEKYNINGF